MTAYPYISVLLVALLVGCPFVCLARCGPMGCECSDGDQQECCCDEKTCCQESSNRDAPTDDSSNRPNQDCACNGAVVEQSTVACPESGTEKTIMLHVDLEYDALSDSVRASLGSRHARHFSRIATGRGICALTCARLL